MVIVVMRNSAKFCRRPNLLDCVYNALLSDGWAPGVGDEVSVSGYHYGDLGVLVADPQLRLEQR